MKLLVMLVVGLFLTFTGAIAQTAPKATPVSAPVITKDSPNGRPIDRNTVDAFIKKIQDCLGKDLENYQQSSYMRYSFRALELKEWLNYQFLEVDSGIDAEWFKQLYEFVNFFSQTKREHDLSSMPENSKFRTDNKDKFEIGVKRFNILIKKPTRANQQRVNYQKREKEKYLKEKIAAAKNKAKG